MKNNKINTNKGKSNKISIKKRSTHVLYIDFVWLFTVVVVSRSSTSSNIDSSS